MKQKVCSFILFMILNLTISTWVRAQIKAASPTADKECDIRAAQEKVEWANSGPHSWLDSELFVQKVETEQKWCHIWASHKWDRLHKAEDFGVRFLTGQGIHPVAGSIVPNSGFAGGLALNLEHALEGPPVRMSGALEGRGSLNSFWEAGGALTLLGSARRLDNRHIDVTLSAVHRSLPRLSFFGMGNSSALANQTLFGLNDTTVKADGSIPLPHGFQLLGLIEGLWANPQGFHSSTIPSIEQVFTAANTPALNISTGYFVYGTGIYWEHPVDECLECWYKTDFSATFRLFHEGTGLPYSFRRIDVVWTQAFDLDFHSNITVGTMSVTGRLVESVATGGDQVPFYLQPTLGGADIDNVDVLRSYRDYRFRAPNALAFQAEYTRSIKDPLGLLLFYDWGKVASGRSDLDFTHMKHSFGAGFTVRVGNLPWFKFYYAWAGLEGSHTTYTGNTNNFTLDTELRGVFH